MTQPDEYTPDDAANADSFAAFAAKDQEAWEADRDSGFMGNLDILETGWNALLGFLGMIPVIGPTLQWFFGVFGGLFGFGDDDYAMDPGDVDFGGIWENITDIFLKPLNVFAELIGGLIPDDLFGGFDASKIITGSFPQSMITGLLDALGDVPILGDLIEALTGSSGGLPDLTDWAEDLLGNVSGWIGGFFNAVTGSDADESDVSAAQAAAQAAEMAAQLIALQTSLAQQEAGVEPTTSSGLSGGDTFERTDSAGIGSDWDANYASSTTTNGKYVLDGHQAVFVPVDDEDQFVLFRRIAAADALTLTSYQRVEMVIGDYVGSGTSFFGGGGTSRIRIYVRLNTAETQGVFVEIEGDSHCAAKFGYRNGGSDVFVGSDVEFTKTKGSKFVVVAGTAGGVRFFQFYAGGVLKLTWNDSGALSAEGASNLGWGWGAANDTSDRPANIDSIHVQDYEPSAVTGTVLTVYRAATSSGWSPSSTSAVADNFYDTVEYKSPDMIWDAINSEATVTRSGTYSISFSFSNSASLSDGDRVWGLVYVDGAMKRHLSTAAATDSGGSVNTADYPVGGACSIYLPAGSVVKPGVVPSAALDPSFIGDAAGTKSWLTITRTG